jgi:glycine/D-amino acid oxidase-like deaminating enzyme
VLQEFEASCIERKGIRLLTPKECLSMAGAVNPRHLMGGMYSPDEVIVDPRQAMAALPAYLSEKFGVRFYFGKAISEVRTG